MNQRNQRKTLHSKTSYRHFRQQFPVLVEQTRRNNENVLTFDKLFKKEDSLPPIKKTEVNPGWVKITKDKNNNISKIYGKSLNEPEIIELLKFKEAQYESELKIDNLNKNIQKSQECDENRFIPIDSLYYEDSFNNDELYEEEDIIEEVETSDSEIEGY
tara:strand:+ start:18245 stop:18721 length:477 start_codon:yes stop_codon:yes gene_type:complete